MSAEESSRSVLVLGETSAKKAPTFSSGDRQDPSRFLDEFNEAAAWNNWVSTDRRKELFFRCLTHYAKEWFLNTFDRASQAYKDMKFDDGTDASMVAKFSKKFITAEWFEKYEEAYENRVQGENESPWEYMNIKRALLRKLDPAEVEDRNEKHTVKAIRKGLLPEVRKFCEYMEKNPYNNLDKTKLNTFEGLEILLRWAEQCQSNIGKVTGGLIVQEVMKLPEPHHVNAILKRSSNSQGTYGSRVNDGSYSRGDTAAMEDKPNQLDLILKKLEKLDKLDKIENDLALTMDRVDMLEKRREGGNQKRASEDQSQDKCYNCNIGGHIARFCTEPCRVCNSVEHTSSSCSNKSKSNQDFQGNSPRN